jgi:hypothetical protein
VIEEDTGAPLEIQGHSADMARAGAPEAATSGKGAGGNDAGSEARLVARDERKNPLISTFDWTDDAAQRIFRVPSGFMRSKTQERIEELARARAAAAIDLALVEEGIEIGKRMMAEMIATYSSSGVSPGVATTAPDRATPSGAPAEAGANRSGYLNEVSPLTARSASGEHREA